MNVKERNNLLLQLFKRNGFNAVRLIGNPSMPAVILFEEMVLSCHVVDTVVHFTDKPKEGNTVYSVDLEGDINGLRSELVKLIDDFEHRTLYRVELIGGDILSPLRKFYGKSQIYLKDYYYDHESRSKYPVFTPGRDVKVYFEKEKAEEAVVKILSVTPDIKLEVV